MQSKEDLEKYYLFLVASHSYLLKPEFFRDLADDKISKDSLVAKIKTGISNDLNFIKKEIENKDSKFPKTLLNAAKLFLESSKV